MTYHDNHFHPFGYVSMVTGLDLMDATGLDDVFQRLTEFAAAKKGPVIAQRLNDETLTEERLPTAADIDDVVSSQPVVIYRYCGHIAAANSKAMSIAGLSELTNDPAGGSFDRLPNGRPNGILRETAVQVVTSPLAEMIEAPSDEEILSALGKLPDAGLSSITAIVSMGEAVWCGVGNEVETLARLSPDLAVDVDVLIIADDPGQLAAGKDIIDQAEGPVRFHGWKGFSDGSLGGHTAAMYEPYADKPTETGTDRLDHAHAIEMGQASLDLGGVVAVHAIGDRANDSVLDVHERLLRQGADPTRLRIEHASILAEPSVARMASMGVVASVQPAFLASEETWLPKRLGEERLSRAYPFKTMLEAGITLLGGSDTPVETPDPEIGINAAVNRHGLNSSQRVGRDQAEAMFSRQILED